MTKLSPDTPKSRRSNAARTFDPQPKPAKKDSGGQTRPPAKRFAVKSPRNRG